MNSLKNLFIFAVLAAVGYGVYVSLMNDAPSSPPPGAEDRWAGPVDVEVPGAGTAPPFDADTRVTTGVVASSDNSPPVSDPGDPAGPPQVDFGPAADPASATAVQPSTTSAEPPRPSSGYPSPSPGRSQAGDHPPDVSSPDSTAASPPAEARPPSQPGPEKIREEFIAFMETAQAKIDEGRLDEVHRVLTSWYGDPRLTAAESARLTDLLDQIAGTVIYSRSPNEFAHVHVVEAGETLETIAETNHVPWQLLARINGIRDPQNLQPGQQLKVVSGPFHAVVHLDDGELTLMVQDRYAGRFPIGIGQDHENLEGTYQVRDKLVNPTYYGREEVVDADDPRNPLGERWIGLGNQIGIHGTNDPKHVGKTQPAGAICLGDRDIEDVYDILSVGSRVVIRR